MRTAVRSGLRMGEQVEILQGLEENQQVVVRGFLGLSDNKAVKVVTTQSAPPPAAEPNKLSPDTPLTPS